MACKVPAQRSRAPSSFCTVMPGDRYLFGNRSQIDRQLAIGDDDAREVLPHAGTQLLGIGQDVVVGEDLLVFQGHVHRSASRLAQVGLDEVERYFVARVGNGELVGQRPARFSASSEHVVQVVNRVRILGEDGGGGSSAVDVAPTTRREWMVCGEIIDAVGARAGVGFRDDRFRCPAEPMGCTRLRRATWRCRSRREHGRRF